MRNRKTTRGAEGLRRWFQSQTDAAKQLGIGTSQMSLLIAGKRKPSLEVAVKIEALWGVPPAWWLEAVKIQTAKDKQIAGRKRR